MKSFDRFIRNNGITDETLSEILLRVSVQVDPTKTSINVVTGNVLVVVMGKDENGKWKKTLRRGVFENANLFAAGEVRRHTASDDWPWGGGKAVELETADIYAAIAIVATIKATATIEYGLRSAMGAVLA